MNADYLFDSFHIRGNGKINKIIQLSRGSAG